MMMFRAVRGERFVAFFSRFPPVLWRGERACACARTPSERTIFVETEFDRRNSAKLPRKHLNFAGCSLFFRERAKTIVRRYIRRKKLHLHNRTQPDRLLQPFFLPENLSNRLIYIIVTCYLLNYENILKFLKF